MKKNTPNVATHLLENPDQYLLNIGKFIRKTSLDELPNLFNIVKGEMVFVGPRPALYNQDDLMTFRVATGVSKLKPGITGWAQINGRDEISMPEKVKLDQEYMFRKSWIFDIEILVKTFTNVLFRKTLATSYKSIEIFKSRTISPGFFVYIMFSSDMLTYVSLGVIII
jgi:O-antigen biosynthesis protein WbqP